MNSEEKSLPGVEVPPPSDVQSALQWVKTYGRSIVFGILCALVLIVGVSWYKVRRAQQEEDARALLQGATTPEQLTALRERFPGTTTAPLAALREGALLAGQGRWDDALRVFEQFRKDHPDHFFRPAADLNVALCLESAARTEEALKEYERFASGQSGHYLQPIAVLGRGRCLSQTGRADEARTVLEDFLAAHPKSNWTDQAEAALQALPRAPAPVADPAAGEKKLDSGM
jgi:predicted negative regulator of RcsB-dependent stress response